MKTPIITNRVAIVGALYDHSQSFTKFPDNREFILISAMEHSWYNEALINDIDKEIKAANKKTFRDFIKERQKRKRHLHKRRK